MGELQYTVRNNAFVRCGQTVQTVTAGFYDIVDSGFGNFGLVPKAMVSDDLIDIPGTVADEIFTDISQFMGLGPRYRAYGLTHKRGYLFFGPPGSGKTSLATMLARRFILGCNGIVVYVGSPSDLYQATSIIRDVEFGRPSMYLIEEADEIINNATSLGILDGEHSIPGAVFVAMTNYKEKLPPRISNRPGRFDRVVLVAAPPRGVQVEYLRRIAARNPEETDAVGIANRIADALEGISITIAHLREAFIVHVLMGLSLEDLRARFQEMAGTDDEEVTEDDIEDEDIDDFGSNTWSPEDDKY